MKVPIYISRTENFSRDTLPELTALPASKYIAYIFEVSLLAGGDSYSDILDQIYDTLNSEVYGPAMISVLSNLPENYMLHTVPKGSLLTLQDIDIEAFLSN
nr:MAG TPA: hypothetical protein [Caudoviricetes sp.]